MRKQREEIEAKKQAEMEAQLKQSEQMSLMSKTEDDMRSQSRMDQKFDVGRDRFVDERSDGARVVQNSALSNITNDQAIRPFHFNQQQQQQPGVTVQQTDVSLNRMSPQGALHFLSVATAQNN